MIKCFRLATIEDLAFIVSIYNEAIRSGTQTADMKEVSVRERVSWFNDHQYLNYALFVLEIDRQIVGWLSLSPYRKGRGALGTTAEISYYLSGSFQSMGLGSEMMKLGIQNARKRGFRNLVAILLDANIPSVGLLNKFGFEEWGRLPRIACINGQLIDHLYWGLKL